MFLLDTDVVSELRKAGDGKADANVVRWLSGIDMRFLRISAITVMEIELGILRIARRDDAQGARLRAWLDEHILPAFAGRVLPVDQAVAIACAALHVLNPRLERDGFTAATALVHSLTVVTRNVADFAPTGVALVNPWDAAA